MDQLKPENTNIDYSKIYALASEVADVYKSDSDVFIEEIIDSLRVRANKEAWLAGGNHLSIEAQKGVATASLMEAFIQQRNEGKKFFDPFTPLNVPAVKAFKPIALEP